MLLGHGWKLWNWESFQNFIKYKFGTGNSIHVWFDYWNPVGPLVRRFGRGLCMIVQFLNWQNWVTLLWMVSEVFLFQLLRACKFCRQIRVLWSYKVRIQLNGFILRNANKMFSTASAKETIRRHNQKVDWCKVVHFKGHIPKMAFITWLAFKGARGVHPRWGMCAVC